MYMAKKVLIVYENMGMGHLRMAKIMERSLQSEPGLVIVNQAGSDLFKINDVKIIDRLWNFCIRKNWIRFTDIFINFILRLLFMPLDEVAEIESIHQRLATIDPDIIISTADVWNHVLGSYASEHKIPFFVVITEISVFMDLVNPYATHLCYFQETVNAIQSFNFKTAYFSTVLHPTMSLTEKMTYVANYYHDYLFNILNNSIHRSINRNYLTKNQAPVKIIGPIADQKHYIPQNSREIRKKLGIDPDIPMVLILSGSIGGKILLGIIRSICKTYQGPLNICAMCGNDQKTYQKIKMFRSRQAAVKVIPYRYQENIEEFFAGSDCVIARPSAGIFIESLLHRIPMVAYGKVTSNDNGTPDIINKYGTGEICTVKTDLTKVLHQVLDNKTAYQKKIEQLLALYTIDFETQERKLKDTILYLKTSSDVATAQVKELVEGFVV
jgi:UDP-N-acetylglucosamine:LPS N-acetylglucosamine transferase